MKQLIIKLKNHKKISGKELMISKARKINEILGNDLDLDIQQKLHKHNNKLKRFIRKSGLLRNQIALNHADDEYTELLYDALLNRSEIVFDSSNEIIKITLPDNFKQVNSNSGQVIYDGIKQLNLFMDYINKSVEDVFSEILYVEDGLVNLSSQQLIHKELDRHIVIGLTDLLYEHEAIVSLPYMVNLHQDTINYILKSAKYLYSCVFSEYENDLELIRVIKMSDDLSEYVPKIEGYIDEDDEKSVNNIKIYSGIDIVFDDVSEDILVPFYKKDKSKQVYYITDVFEDDFEVKKV